MESHALRADLHDPAALASLGHIEVVARWIVDGFLSGLHRSPRKGFSVEFADFRPYQPGDDLRYVDWNIYGRLDRLYANFTGEFVRKGSPIFEIYSPDLVASQREYLLALENLSRAEKGASPEYLASARSLLEASRDRLRLWGLSDEQLGQATPYLLAALVMTGHAAGPGFAAYRRAASPVAGSSASACSSLAPSPPRRAAAAWV